MNVQFITRCLVRDPVIWYHHSSDAQRITKKRINSRMRGARNVYSLMRCVCVCVVGATKKLDNYNCIRSFCIRWINLHSFGCTSQRTLSFAQSILPYSSDAMHAQCDLVEVHCAKQSTVAVARRLNSIFTRYTRFAISVNGAAAHTMCLA